MNYVNDLAAHGFAVLENVVDSETVSVLLQEVANARIDNLESQRAGKAFGQHRRVLHFEYSAIDLPGGLRWFEEDETT